VVYSGRGRYEEKENFMAHRTKSSEARSGVNLDESSVYRDEPEDSAAAGEIVTGPTLDRLEAIAGGADEDDPRLFEPEFSKQVEALDAETEEEIDALRVNLYQDDDEIGATRDGTGRIVDDAAEEELARHTETGPMQPDQGVVSAEPGRDDTSRILRRHHPNTSVARSQDIVEGNLDEPRDEEVTDRKVDEGTAG
jgi:hypothetical protein